MLQPTDVFCHTILFAKFNMLASSDLHFLGNIELVYTPHDFQVEQGHSVSPINYEGFFVLKLFMVYMCGGKFFLRGGGGRGERGYST